MSSANGHREWFELVVMVKASTPMAEELLSGFGDACDKEGIVWRGSMEPVHDPLVYRYKDDLEYGKYPKGTVLHVFTDSIHVPEGALPLYLTEQVVGYSKRPKVIACGGSGPQADPPYPVSAGSGRRLCKACESVLAEIDHYLAVDEEHALYGRVMAWRRDLG